MKKHIKVTVLAIVLGAGFSLTAFAGGSPEIPERNLADIQNEVTKLSEEMALSLPFTSTLGLNWSDAYIGESRFGVGVTMGLLTISFGAFGSLLDYFYFGYADSDSLNRFYTFAYTVEGRMGGFPLPFDIGFKIGGIPAGIIDFDYLVTGADIRYALMQDSGTLPAISLGIGINYLKIGSVSHGSGGFWINYGTDKYFANDGGVDDTRVLKIDSNTFNLDFKAQVSKTFSVVTPYLGLGGNYAWTNAGYTYTTGSDFEFYDYSGTAYSRLPNENEMASIREEYGVNISSNEISSMVKNDRFNFRVFGGISFNIKKNNIDLTGFYNFRDSNFAITAGFRGQFGDNASAKEPRPPKEPRPAKEQRPARPQNKTSNAAGLEGAIDRASKDLIGNLPENARIAVINISSNESDLSALIVDELEFKLVSAKKFTIVDRLTLETIRAEQNFQMSGDVSDESAVSVGRILGANIVITGSVTKTDANQRLSVRALDVTTAQIVAMVRETF